MNFTRDYNDHLDGEYLACRPGSIAEGLKGVCKFGLPMFGSMFLVNGLWLLCLLCVQRRHRMLLATQTRDGDAISNFRISNVVYPQSGAVTATFSHVEKLLLSTGISAICFSLTTLVNGLGTMYPTTHIRGQISDIICAIAFGAMWYNSLLGHRGAIYFKSSIPQPQGLTHQSKKSKLLSTSKLLDMAQSWLAPPISLILLGLLEAGRITRGWHMFIMQFLAGVYGFRSFVSIVFQRLHTLKRVAGIVKANQSGTREELDRRRGFIQSKSTSLVLDLIVVFYISVLIPTSYVLVGSTFNSRRLAIHVLVNGVLNVTALTMTCVHMHSKFNELRKKSRVRALNATTVHATSVVKGKSLPSGLSVVEQSDVYE